MFLYNKLLFRCVCNTKNGMNNDVTCHFNTHKPLVRGQNLCPIEVTSGLTDKGQIKSISVSHWIKGAPTKININILSENT